MFGRMPLIVTIFCHLEAIALPLIRLQKDQVFVNLELPEDCGSLLLGDGDFSRFVGLVDVSLRLAGPHPLVAQSVRRPIRTERAARLPRVFSKHQPSL